MKQLSLLVIALCITCGSVSAQQALFGGQMPQSPEIHADKTVTFRCMAPGAQKVQITGDFLPTRKIDTPMGKFDAPGVADLTKDDKGVWSYTTTSPLSPELYSYTMMVDGASVTDHLNVYTVRDISNVSNILTKNHYPFTYMETDGGHIWRNWRIYLGEFAQKIFK